jgi:hypothetical protein
MIAAFKTTSSKKQKQKNSIQQNAVYEMYSGVTAHQPLTSITVIFIPDQSWRNESGPYLNKGN